MKGSKPHLRVLRSKAAGNLRSADSVDNGTVSRFEQLKRTVLDGILYPDHCYWSGTIEYKPDSVRTSFRFSARTQEAVTYLVQSEGIDTKEIIHYAVYCLYELLQLDDSTAQDTEEKISEVAADIEKERPKRKTCVVTEDSRNLLNDLKSRIAVSRDSVFCAAIIIYRDFIESERKRRRDIYPGVLDYLEEFREELQQTVDHLRGIIAPYDPAALRLSFLGFDFDDLLGEIELAIKNGTPIKPHADYHL